MVAFKFLFLGLALWVQAIAAWPGLDVYYVTCATRLGGQSTRPIPTSTKTIATTFTWTRRVFTKVTSTITPNPDTTTVITTEIEATTITNNANTVTGTATSTCKRHESTLR